MFPTKVVENIKTNFIFNSFFIENRAVYEIRQRKRRKYATYTQDNGKDTHTTVLIKTNCFSTAKMITERASMLR